MNNFNLKLNLLKFTNAGVCSVKGRGKTLKCVVIPIEDNHIFVSKDSETNKPKAAYIDMTAWELSNPKYEDTHMVKQSFPKEVREQISEEERKNQPILGSMKPLSFDRQNGASTCDAPFVSIENDEDLPF